MKIALVAGETSGDMLGAGLLAALKKTHPNLEALGVAGPFMQATGCHTLFDMERLAVMGFVEPLKRLPELIKMRKSLIEKIIAFQPDVFVGIDAPAFNTGLELKLKQAGIKTVHYVSPSIWAWRQNRIHKIKRAVDLMLTLLPFENAIYTQHGVKNVFVGHPLADEIPLEVDQKAARAALGLHADKKIMAILPGSRQGEIQLLTQPFLEAAKRCYQADKGLAFVVPMVSEVKRQLFLEACDLIAPELPIKVIVGESRTAMAASDVVLLSSGTATLEAMLLGRPMVVAYKLKALNYAIAKRLVKCQHFSLPNLLAGKALVPEYIQDKVIASDLSDALMHYVTTPKAVLRLQATFAELHQQLRQNANEKAARAVLALSFRT